MPSRLGVGFILLFWAASTAYVGYREVWPRLFSDAPPPIRIDLADEASQALPTRWTVYRGDERVGGLETRMEYVPADDSFRFVNHYRQLTLATATFSFRFPRLETAVRVARGGELREQTMTGELQAAVGAGPVAVPVGEKAAAEVVGVVVNGELTGRCRIWYPATDKEPVIDRPLDPVPVPAGQVLNPMSPVGRLRDVHPGRRWVIRKVDPLQDALALLLREVLKNSKVAATALPRPANEELLAEVLRTPEVLRRPRLEPVECWVIEYRGDDVQARTWVSREDGRVLRQEATGFGERLRFDRED